MKKHSSVKMLLTKNLIGLIVFFAVKSSSYGQAFNPEYRNFTELQNDSALGPAVPLIVNSYKANNQLLKTKTAAAIMDVSVMSGISSSNQVPNKLAIVTTNAVGGIPVQQTVAPNGAFNYSVPIECVPGRNGFQPQISFSYNSMGGASIMGNGWAIGGLSAITRTGSTYYYDGKTAADDLSNASSKMLLDGMRLIYLEVNTASGFPVFETEQGYIKAEQVTGTNYIKYFKVSYPNGSVGIFGYESNTTQQLVYPLTKLTDALGRTITYSYTFENNQYYINKIEYGASKGNAEHFASIVFTYKTRPDTWFNYVSGRKITENKLLDKVECKNGTAVIRSYTFTYETNIDSQLKQIDCSMGVKKLNPLVFYYGSGSSSVSLNTSDCLLTSSFKDVEVKDLVIGKGKIDPWTEDDGLIVHPGRASYYEQVYNYKNYYNSDQEIAVYLGLRDVISTPAIIKAGNGFIKAFSMNTDNTPGDEVIRINNNVENNQDVIRFKIYKANMSLGMYLLKEDREVVFQHNTVITKVNSFFLGSKWSYTTYTSITPKEYLTGDFDGDGRPDVFAISRNNPLNTGKPSQCYIFNLNNGTTIFSGQVSGFNFNASNTESDIIFGMDYDGDGKTDVCHIHANGTDVYSYNGSSFSKVASITDLKQSTVKNKQFLVGDINGDGKTDLLLSPFASYYNSYYEIIPVATHRYCPYCRREDPGHEFDYCKYCNKYLGEVTSCYKCGSQLGNYCNDGYYNSNGKCCRNCGTETTVYRTQYIDYGNKWSGWFAKGMDGFEKMELALFNHEKSNDGTPNKYLLQDMNGDGKADLVRLSGSYIYVYKAVNGSISPSYENGVYAYVPSKSEMIPSIVADNQYHTQLLVLSSDNATMKRITFTRDESKERLLTGVANSLGVITKINYQRLNGNGYYDYPSYGFYTKGTGAVFPYENFNGPLFVAVQTELWNNDKQYDKMTYRYTNAMIHRQGLGFRGFEKFTIIDNSGRETELTFNPQQFCLPLTESNDIYSTSTTYSVSVASNKKATIRLTKKTHTDKLNNNTLTATYTYDNYGNPTQEIADYGGGLKTVSDQTYSNQTASLYILGLPLINTVTQYRNGATWVTKTEKEYLANTLPKNVKTYVNGNKTSENQFTYDASGNVLTERTIPYASTDVLERSYTYDTKERYLITEKDEYGKTTTFAGYNYFNQPGTVKDFKGNTTTYAYDEAGRTVKVVQPDGVTKETSFAWSVTGDKIYAVVNTATGQPKQTVYFDGFNREVQTNVISFNGTELNTQKVYDNYGRLSKESQPSFGNASRWTSYAYDSYNRVTQTTLPTGKTVKYTYGSNTVKTEDADRITTVTKDATGAVLKINDAAGDIVYTLRPDGQPSAVTAPNGSKTEFTFDAYGRTTKMTDPSAGTLQYGYDANGNINKQTDANGRATETVYDKFGRPVKTEVKNGTTVELSTTYTYNTDDVLTTVSGGGKTTTYTYDNLLRMLSDKEVVSGIILTRSYTYSAGKIQKITYSGLAGTAPPVLEYVYNANGYLSSIKADATTIKTIDSKNNFGQTTQYTLGNGVTVTRGFDANGMPSEIKTAKGSTILQHFTYAIDAQRNTMAWRKDNLRNLTETFTYDKQYRLTHSNGKTIAAYDAMGNITSKTDAGTMEYKVAGKPYAISDLTANPSTVPVRQQDITYNGMQRPATISENNTLVSFTYGYDYKRCKMEVRQNTSLEYTRCYLSDCYETDVPASGTATERLYFGGTPYNAAVVYTRTGTGAWTINYIHRDHLGSITALTDGNGNKTAEYSFDPWGRQRDPATQIAYAPDKAPALLLARGYTGHEHLTQFGLVNMNARLYDPVLGRFLSPDPYVQAPDWSQNFNRYSYCVNNPLMYNDEYGELFGIDDLIFGVIGGIINLGVNIVKGNIKGDFWDILGKGGAAFGAGFFTGFTTTYGPGAWAGSGAVLGATNSWLDGAKGWDIAKGAGLGAVSGFVGGYAGQLAANNIGNFALNQMSISSQSIIGGATLGAISGAASGFAGGFTIGFIMTGNFQKSLGYGWEGSYSGAMLGLATGGVTGWRAAKQAGNNVWTGKSPSIGYTGQVKYDFTPDPYGDNVTLYRGVSGSENSDGFLFMTDNLTYATTYAQQGSIIEVTIPRATLFQMEQNLHLTKLTGSYFGRNTPYTEYCFSPIVKPLIINLSK